MRAFSNFARTFAQNPSFAQLYQFSVLVVELRGYVSNSCRFAITFCWWLWQREAYSFPLIHEQNQKALYKCGEINEFVIKYFLPRIEPTRGGAAADLV